MHRGRFVECIEAPEKTILFGRSSRVAGPEYLPGGRGVNMTPTCNGWRSCTAVVSACSLTMQHNEDFALTETPFKMVQEYVNSVGCYL